MMGAAFHIPVSRLFVLFGEMAAHSLVGLVSFTIALRVLYTYSLNATVFSDRLFAEISSQSVAWFFYSFNRFFSPKQKFLILMKSNLLIIFFYASCIELLLIFVC